MLGIVREVATAVVVIRCLRTEYYFLGLCIPNDNLIIPVGRSNQLAVTGEAIIVVPVVPGQTMYTTL